MLRTSITGLVLVVMAVVGLSPAYPQDKKKTAVDIIFHGHSFFRVRSSKGVEVMFDPHVIPNYGRPVDAKGDPLDLKTDIALLSHYHNDHTQIGVITDEKVIGKLKVLNALKGSPKNPEWNSVDETVKGVRVRSVGSYHDDQQGLKYGRNGCWIIEIEGWKICHLGDLGHILSPAQVKAIGPIDVLMVPVGGIYSLNGDEAKRVVNQLKPKEFVFPMHAGNKAAGYDDLLTPDEFVEKFPRANVTSSDDNVLQLYDARKTEVRPRPTVVLLNYRPKGLK